MKLHIAFYSYFYKGFLLLISCYLLLNPAQANPAKYVVQNFTPTDYRAGIQNIDFAQNRDMTLFVANNLGVLSYNGTQWKTHDFKTGIKKRSLAFDERNNRLYVGSQGAFGYFEEDWNYISLHDQIPEEAGDFDEVWDVYLSDSKVFFCTFQGIYIYDGAAIEVIQHPNGLNRSFYPGGKLFSQSQHGQLFELEDDKLIRSLPQIQVNQTIAGITPLDDGYLVFYNSGQIEFVTSYGAEARFPKLVEALKGTYVNHVLQLSDTRLVISTQTSGVFLYDAQSNELENISAADGLQSNACLRSYQDYSGHLWIGMQNGIALIHINSPIRLVEIQGSGYEAFENIDGAYYTSSNGIYYAAGNATEPVFLPGTEGPAYGLQEIAGKLYAGHHTGLFLMNKDAAVRIARTDGLWKVKQLQSNPKYAIGGTYSGLYLFQVDENQQLKPLHEIQGFDASSRFFEEDQLGRIWVGQYYKGLYQVGLSDDLTYAAPVNVSDDCQLPINEQIILGRIGDELHLASNKGLWQLDPINCNVQNGHFTEAIGTQPVYLFAQDRKNNVHIVTENSVGFFKQISANNYQLIPSSLYELRYHLNNDLLNVSVNTQHGILFSANEGFINYNPSLEITAKIEESLLISQVFSVTENKALYRQKPFEDKPKNIGNLVVGPRTKVLKIDVESFQYKNLANQQFRYFLRGFDDDYGQWTNSTSKEYTNLQEGTYEFVAQARNYLGEVTSAQELILTVRPPFYSSNFAKMLYVIFGILLFVFVYRFQKVRYKRKAQELENAKRIELATKQQKLNEIEKQKEKELQQLKAEKMQSELQHINNLLAASTMNLVVKNEFIESIKAKLKHVRQSGQLADTKQALEKIVKEIDITLRIQEDWEQFEYHFDQVHGGFLNQIRSQFPDLSPNEQKLCAFLRLNFSTKDIANLLGISLRGVEVARYRLRRKLGLRKGQNLSKFILEYQDA